MRIHDASWRRFRLPFVAPFWTAHGETTHREGLILRITTDDGASGLGEATPLAEFGGGDTGLAETALIQLAPALIGCEVEEVDRLIEARLPYRPESSALRCALDTALLDLESRRQGVRLAGLLAPDVRFTIPVNATIGEPDTDLAAQAARRAVAGGFQTIKLKVGVGGSIADEARRVAAVRTAAGPSVALRLDANGAWQPDLAIRTLHALDEFDIELIEQPVAAHDLEGLATVRHSVAILLAADEVLTDLDSARRVIEAGAADALVVKPMACGGLREARRIIDLANDAGLRVIVTSAIESGVGVAACLHLAATLPEGSPACGLATAGLLADDLILHPLDIANGHMRLPALLGLGVDLDEERLDAFAVAEWRHTA